MPFDNPATSYSDTTPQKRIITDYIALIDPADAPLVDALGGLDGAASKFRFANWPGTICEWLEDDREDLTDALNGSITSNVTTITVDDASLFQEGMILLVDSEQMWISSVATATEILTVTRNYSGTQASHADNAVVETIGLARLEAAESDDLAFTDRTVGSNFTQIFQREVKVSGTMEKVSQYGIDDEYQYQVNKAIPHLMRLIEKQLYRGARKAGSATTPRAAGGLGTFITDNTVNAGGALVQADFEDALEAAYGDGGKPRLSPTNPANMQVIKNFYDSSQFLRTERTETTVGMNITRVLTPFGEVDLFLDRWAPVGSQWILDPDHAGLATLREFYDQPLAVTGDYKRGEVIGEFTICVRLDKAHAVVTGIS